MEAALPGLEAALRDPEQRVRRAAALTLARRLADAKDWDAQQRVIRSLLEVIAQEDEEDLIRQFQFSEPSASLLLWVLKLRSRYPEPVRETAARALGCFSPYRTWIAEQLEECLKYEDDERVRAAGAAALARLRRQEQA
jgi:HEAT repeat protein